MKMGGWYYMVLLYKASYIYYYELKIPNDCSQ